MYSWDNSRESLRSYYGRRAVFDGQLGGMHDAGERVAREIRDGVSAQTRDLLGSMDAMTGALGADLGALRADIDSGLGHVAGVLTGGFAAELRRSDDTKRALDRLVESSESPEHTKALENFRHALYSRNRGLWDEALEYLTAAIEGDHVSKGYKLDWRFHWVKGELLLGSPKSHDWEGISPAKAEHSFLLAARYAKGDARDEAARAMLLASVAAFAQSRGEPAKLGDMLKHAEAAVALDEALAEASFQMAKARMALGAPGDALPALRGAIERDPAFAVRAAEDPDCRKHEGTVVGLLQALRAEKLKGLEEQLRPLLERHAVWVAKSPDVARLRPIAAWRELVGGAKGWGVLELLRYERDELEPGKAEVQARVDELVALERNVRAELARLAPLLARSVKLAQHEVVFRWKGLVEAGGWMAADVDRFLAECRAVQPVIAELRRFEAEMHPVQGEARLVESYAAGVVIPRGGGRSERSDIRRRVDEKQPRLVDGLAERFKGPKGFVRIPAGRFTMGSLSVEAAPDENPRHEVTLTRSFELLATPVTQAQWEALMGSNPSTFRGADRPVENVTWFEAVAFCNALSRATGLEEAYEVSGTSVRWKGLGGPGFRLPTEAEWEYASRAGTTTERYGEVDAVAWHHGNAGQETRPVGKKQPNAWGLYDMLGNVWEWVWDWKGDYSGDAQTDPTGPSSGIGRADRGGGWGSDASFLRAPRRCNYPPSYSFFYLGFRPARSLP